LVETIKCRKLIFAKSAGDGGTGFKERKMWSADAVRAATHMDQLEEAVDIVVDADFVAYEATADLMIAIAEKEGEWTDRTILRLLSTIVDECSLEALAGVMQKVFSAEATRSAMWTILKACTMAKCIRIASDWLDLMTNISTLA
jgi:hypothetical protein